MSQDAQGTHKFEPNKFQRSVMRLIKSGDTGQQPGGIDCLLLKYKSRWWSKCHPNLIDRISPWKDKISKTRFFSSTYCHAFENGFDWMLPIQTYLVQHFKATLQCSKYLERVSCKKNALQYTYLTTPTMHWKYILQCTICNKNMYTRANFSYKVVHCGIGAIGLFRNDIVCCGYGVI